MLYVGLTINVFCIYTNFWQESGSLKLSPVGLFLFLVFNLVLALGFLSHLRCWLSDPGRTPKIEPPNYLEAELSRYCTLCKQWKPPRTHHCSDCKVCIHRMDHHCIWVNNCVGATNHKYFFLFLFYISLGSAVSLLIISVCVFQFFYSGQTKFASEKVVTGIACGVVCGFTLYTGLDFLLDQTEFFKDNQTTVESYQRRYGKSQNLVYTLYEVFGTNNCVWLLPVKPKLNLNYLEETYKYSQVPHEEKKLPQIPVKKPLLLVFTIVTGSWLLLRL